VTHIRILTPMLSFSQLARGFLSVVTVPAVLVMTSCGTDDGLGQRFAVSGKVTYNGSPLAKGAISFVPEDPNGIGATGAVENGAYILSTGGNNDGARVGKYKVNITSKEDSYAKAKADFAKDSKGVDFGFVPRQYLANAEAAAKSLIPPGYGDTRTTTLKAEVKEQSNTIDFKLSDADAPAAPKAPEKGRGRKGQ
jgi:hypothetical protein